MLKRNPLFSLVFSVLFASTAWADAQIAAVSDLSVNLGAHFEQGLQVSGNSNFKLSIDPGELADPLKSGNLQIQIVEPAHVLSIHTRTSIVTFQHKKFAIQAKDSQGNVLSNQLVDLSVLPIFVVTVTDAPGTTHDDPKFLFDSDPGIEYFAPVSEGVQLMFQNNSSETILIHGTGAVDHQDFDKPTSPGGVYTQANRIYPAAGDNKSAYYTIHQFYNPDRNAVFNYKPESKQ